MERAMDSFNPLTPEAVTVTIFVGKYNWFEEKKLLGWRETNDPKQAAHNQGVLAKYEQALRFCKANGLPYRERQDTTTKKTFYTYVREVGRTISIAVEIPKDKSAEMIHHLFDLHNQLSIESARLDSGEWYSTFQNSTTVTAIIEEIRAAAETAIALSYQSGSFSAGLDVDFCSDKVIIHGQGKSKEFYNPTKGETTLTFSQMGYQNMSNQQTEALRAVAMEKCRTLLLKNNLVFDLYPRRFGVFSDGVCVSDSSNIMFRIKLTNTMKKEKPQLKSW